MRYNLLPLSQGVIIGCQAFHDLLMKPQDYQVRSIPSAIHERDEEHTTVCALLPVRRRNHKAHRGRQSLRSAESLGRAIMFQAGGRNRGTRACQPEQGISDRRVRLWLAIDLSRRKQNNRVPRCGRSKRRTSDIAEGGKRGKEGGSLRKL